MTQDYEQKKRECWKEFQNEVFNSDIPISPYTAMSHVFDRAYALGKKFGNPELYDAGETVIQGWVGRDLNGSLYVYCHEPERNLMKCLWEGEIMSISISDDMFPDLTWESDPEEVEIQIKRKKK